MPTKPKTVPAVRTTCAWQQAMEESDVWCAGCGTNRMFCFDDGGPKHNHFTFCPYCGALIVETVWTGPDEVVSEKAKL